MARKTTKKGKLTAAQKRRLARRRQSMRRGIAIGAVAAVCVVCLILMANLNRPLDRATTWTVADGAAAMDLAPTPETPATPTPAPTEEPAAEETAFEDDGDDLAPADDGFVTFDDADAADAEVQPVAEDELYGDGPVTITLTAAGDCTLGGCLKHDTYKVFKKYVDENGYDYFLKNVKDLFASDDLTVVNLEGPLTDVGTMTTKSGICFRGDPEWTAILTGASVELCNYANNHNLDMGQEGFDRTLQSLDDAGLGYCVYDKVYHTTIKGVRVTALGFDKWANKQDEVVAAVQRERADCDLLIVNFHWGREMHYEAMSDQKSMGHAIVDAGADLVIGTHPHVFGGVELYKGKYIAYSLGNFCFGGNTVPSDQRAMIFQQQFIVEDGQVSDGGINIIPCLVSGNPKKNDFQPYILAAKEGTALLKKIARYSINMGSVKWMPGSYPEQIGLVPSTGTAAAVPLVAAAAPAAGDFAAAATVAPTEPVDFAPASEVFTEEDGFDNSLEPYPAPSATVEPLNGLGARALTEAEAAAFQEQIYLDQMTKN